MQTQNQETILNQLKEITGIHDAQALKHAYDASKGDITQAISILTEASSSPAASSNMCQPAQPSVAPSTARVADNSSSGVASTTKPRNKQGRKSDSQFLAKYLRISLGRDKNKWGK